MSTVFSCSRTHLEGKQGKLKTNSAGHYEILAGAYNAANNTGDFYVFNEQVKRLFTVSTMMRKLNANQLYGEADHPSLDEFLLKANNQSQGVAAWLRRLAVVHMKNAAFAIHGVRLAELDKRVNGKPVMGVYLTIAPSHPQMIAGLQDPLQNTALSVRSFVNRRMEMGQVLCVAKDIVTYDWIQTGGIADATKFNTPSLEAETKVCLPYDYDQGVYMPEERALITEDVLNIYAEMEQAERIAGIESDVAFDTVMIRDQCGWREVPSLNNLVTRNW